MVPVSGVSLSSMESVDSIENRYIKIKLEDGIIIAVFQLRKVTIEIAKKMVKARLVISNQTFRPLMVDLGNMKRINNDAMDYFASGEAVSYVKAAAILSHNRFQTLFTNFYLKFNKPPVPTRMFYEKQKAIKWLNEHK